MSTKSSIASDPKAAWHLEEEMLDETTHLVIEPRGPINLVLHANEHGSHLQLELTPALLDTIARIHAERGFPHQRPKEIPAAP